MNDNELLSYLTRYEREHHIDLFDHLKGDPQGSLAAAIAGGLVSYRTWWISRSTPASAWEVRVRFDAPRRAKREAKALSRLLAAAG